MTDHDHIPSRLASDLRRMHETPAPSALDERILAAARSRMRARPILLRPMPWLAAAAAVAIGVTAWMLAAPRPSAPPPPMEHPIASTDRITILDAFAIARALRDGTPTTPDWDLNTDGVVDNADVDLAAKLSVRLEGETS